MVLKTIMIKRIATENKGTVRYEIYRECFTLFIFSFGCDKRFGKCERTSQLRTTWVCSSVPVTMLPTALSAAVWGGDKTLSINSFVYKVDSTFFIILRKCKNARAKWLPLTVFLDKVLRRTERQFWILNKSCKKWNYIEKLCEKLLKDSKNKKKWKFKK